MGRGRKTYLGDLTREPPFKLGCCIGNVALKGISVD